MNSITGDIWCVALGLPIEGKRAALRAPLTPQAIDEASEILGSASLTNVPAKLKNDVHNEAGSEVTSLPGSAPEDAQSNILKSLEGLNAVLKLELPAEIWHQVPELEGQLRDLIARAYGIAGDAVTARVTGFAEPAPVQRRHSPLTDLPDQALKEIAAVVDGLSGVDILRRASPVHAQGWNAMKKLSVWGARGKLGLSETEAEERDLREAAQTIVKENGGFYSLEQLIDLHASPEEARGFEAREVLRSRQNPRRRRENSLT